MKVLTSVMKSLKERREKVGNFYPLCSYFTQRKSSKTYKSLTICDLQVVASFNDPRLTDSQIVENVTL
jgi:hypothetical protein